MMRKFLLVFHLTLGMLPLDDVHAQVSYKISSPSQVQISGTSTFSDWVVRSDELSGQMIFVPSGKKVQENEFPGGIIKDGKAAIEVSTIKSEKGETMDNKMYNALKKDSHPLITFVLTSPMLVSNTAGKATATGNVEIAGVIRRMTFDLDVTWARHAFHLQGSAPMKLTEFQVEPPTAMFGQIVTGDEIMVKLDLYFSPVN